MVKHHVRHISVTDGGGLIGFLSARDLLALTPLADWRELVS
jgi:CBS domain-containing protein